MEELLKSKDNKGKFLDSLDNNIQKLLKLADIIDDITITNDIVNIKFNKNVVISSSENFVINSDKSLVNFAKEIHLNPIIDMNSIDSSKSLENALERAKIKEIEKNLQNLNSV